jgi:hypothetical protein
MYEAAKRFRSNLPKACYLLYIGDHDPSGEDMVRDIRERLSDFQVTITVEKLALNRNQVDYYKLPPNFTKVKDTRARGYVEAHGTKYCWEVDALPPDVLNGVIRQRLEELIDLEAFERWSEIEATDKLRLRQFIADA